MSSAWPTSDAFCEVVTLKPGKQTWPVSVSVSGGDRAPGAITLSIAAEVMTEMETDIGDRFRVFVNETAGELFVRLVRDDGGAAQISQPPVMKKSGGPGRGLVRLSRLAQGVPDPRRGAQAEYRLVQAGSHKAMEIRLPLSLDGGGCCENAGARRRQRRQQGRQRAGRAEGPAGHQDRSPVGRRGQIGRGDPARAGRGSEHQAQPVLAGRRAGAGGLR